MGMSLLCRALAAGLFLSVAAQADVTKYEAEDQALASGATVKDSTGVSGGKYVNANGFTFKVTVESTGMYDLVIQMWVKQYDWFNSSIYINGGTTALATFLTNSPTSAFTTYTLTATAKLLAGENSITVSGGSSNFDYLTVARHPAAVFTLDAAPVAPEANEAAYKLKAFLTQNFGSRTVSGMMIGDNTFNYDYANMRLIDVCVPADSCKNADSLTTWKGQEDIRLFKQKSGYYPALGGFDMLFSAGGHSDEGWFLGYTENNVKMAKQLWNFGGIPAFTWHWKVGTDTVFYAKSKGFNNAACTGGVAASSSDNTCFNYTKAFTDSTCSVADTASSQYKLMMADVDKVSKWFLQLQDSGVAALWRPLHEAAGGWFWWGVGGSTCYKSLYRLVFDRMVNVNGVHNLIWVWNIERDPTIGYDYAALNPAWYPGDDYVDIIGVDVYNSSGDQKSNINGFSKIIDEMGSSKLLALTENGPIPDVDSMATDGAVWSYWMPWYNTWSNGFLNQTPDSVWKKNLADDRILKLETMPGWANFDAGVPAVKAHTKFLVGASMQGRTLYLNIPNGTADIAVYSLLGTRVAKYSQAAGTKAYDLRALSRGRYIVQIKGTGVNATKVIVIK